LHPGSIPGQASKLFNDLSEAATPLTSGDYRLLCP